jgi:hypothetical protein
MFVTLARWFRSKTRRPTRASSKGVLQRSSSCIQFSSRVPSRKRISPKTTVCAVPSQTQPSHHSGTPRRTQSCADSRPRSLPDLARTMIMKASRRDLLLGSQIA